MLVNSTKNTLKVFKISIAWNDEEGFNQLNKIITLFKWLKINVVFEPVDLAGQNYQKNMEYGIDEPTLTHIKKTNLLIHTKLDYQYFDKDLQMNVDKYLNIAMQNYFIKYAFDTDSFIIKDTYFFENNKDYIANINDFYKLNIEQNSYTKTENNVLQEDANFYYSYGENFSIFVLNQYKDECVKNFTIELLKYLNLIEKANFLSNFKTIDLAIQELKKDKNIIFTSINDVKNLKIEWKNIGFSLPNVLDKEKTKLNGKYKVCEIVEAIKEKKIKIMEEYELHRILANDIEVYPNINFWEDIVINPIIELQKSSLTKISVVRI